MCDVKADVTEHVVTDLCDDAEYRFDVSACNKAGKSEAKSSDVIKTKLKIGKVFVVRVLIANEMNSN